jgi:dUTP pyrophosphatase
MELMGVIAALEEIGRFGEPCQGVIYSDSRYVVDAFAKNWITNWQKNGWVTSSKAPVKNQDLWTRLLKALAPHKMTFRWVKGHADHPENERCDQLATAAADKVGWSFDDTAAPLTQASEWVSAGTGETEDTGEGRQKGGAPAGTSARKPETYQTFQTSQTPEKEAPLKIRVRYLSDQIDKLQPPTNSANWVDLRSAEDVELKKGDFRLISLGVAMKLPEGYEAHIVPRSSTYKNFGIIQANHHGVVDNSYCGDGDLWRMPVIAMRDTHIHINDRICQFRIERRQPDLIFEETEHLDSEDRGGFGSTGVQ